jgi:dolichol-phosphate mannosyltransferase
MAKNSQKKGNPEESKISVVVPVFRGEATVVELVRRLKAALAAVSARHEIILVDDGSPDGAWEKITGLARRCPGVVGVRLSRNFGQHYAITAGLQRARGEWVVVMDGDLQDRPEEIPALWEKAREGYDLVLARRKSRQDGWGKRVGSRLFYGLLGYLTGQPQDPAVANFGIYHRRVIRAVNAMPESIRYFPTMVRWVGFRAGSLDVAHAARSHGASNYSLRRLCGLATDICLVNSDKPLRLVVGLGFMVSAGGFLAALHMLWTFWHGRVQILGYASLIVSVWVLSGILILIVGMVGLYVGKTFEGTKRRPSFVVAEVTSGNP